MKVEIWTNENDKACLLEAFPKAQAISRVDNLTLMSFEIIGHLDASQLFEAGKLAGIRSITNPSKIKV